jgi:surface antigen Omp85-like protein
MRPARVRRLLALLVLLVTLATRLQAQEEDEVERGTAWRLSYFPYLSGGANDGPVVSAKVRYWQPAEYEDRVTANAALDAGAGISPRGSRYVGARFSAPQLIAGWRFKVGAIADRQVRFGYFGLGNDTEKNDDLVTDDVPFLYRVRRTRYEGIFEATRRLHGPLQLAFQGDFESVRFSSLPGPSTFTADFGDELKQDDAAGRIALVYDTRDVEYNTKRGLLLEAGAQAGSGGDGYTRLYSVLRGYVQVREGTVVAVRLAGSGMGGTPTLNARFDLPAWEHHISVLGGEQSHRAVDTGRLAGKGTLFGNLEVRHELINVGDFGAVTLLAFVDAGRVFEEESFRLTTDDMAVGGGGGIGLRIWRDAIFTFNFAGGPDGFNFEVGSGWMF